MLARDLEDWLTEEGDRVVHAAAAAGSPDVLTPTDRLVYEVWLLDTEQRNGGVSQYVCNRGLDPWDSLSRLATPALPSFRAFAARVDAVVSGVADPYRAVVESAVDLDVWYDKHQARLVAELQSVVRERTRN